MVNLFTSPDTVYYFHMMETISQSLTGRLSVSTAEKQFELVLEKGTVWRIEGARHGVTVSCVNGAVWLTQEEDPDDHVLGPSERFSLDRCGRTVVMALEPSRISVARW